MQGKGIPRQAEVALGVPGRLRPRIIMTFGTTRVVGRQPNAPAAFTPLEIPGTHFQRLSRPQGTWFCRKEPRKKSQVTPPGFDPGTVRLVAQRLNHPATLYIYIYMQIYLFTSFFSVFLNFSCLYHLCVYNLSVRIFRHLFLITFSLSYIYIYIYIYLLHVSSRINAVV
jgi:hypothetical protein